MTQDPKRSARAQTAAPGASRAVPAPPAAPGGHAAGQWSMLTAKPGDQLVIMPGQLYFGTKAASARTLLGSCVSITLWHPQRRLGGMCHFLLPRRNTPPAKEPEGRYGEEAVAMMVQWLRMAGTQPQEYEATLYGGADTQPGSERDGRSKIGERNIEMGWQLIDHYGFMLQAVDVGENIPRTVQINLTSGLVDMRRGAAIARRGA